MSNEYNGVFGMQLYTDKPIGKPREIDIDSASTADLFPGSPYYVVAGKARALPDSGGGATANDQLIAGTVLLIRDSNGVSRMAYNAGDTGYKAEVLWHANEQYKTTINSTAFANPGDIGKVYNFIFETGTAGADRFTGRGISAMALAGSTEAASTRQFVVSGLTGVFGNAGGVANTEVYGTINSANHQQW